MSKLVHDHINILNANLGENEKMTQLEEEWQRLYAHFDSKARKGKRNFQAYKYASIILAAITTITSSLQVIYLSTFPLWILPVVSSFATVAVAFLGASSAQKIWINSRSTGQKLQAEKFLFNQGADRYYSIPLENKIKVFSERLIQLWNEGHGKWEQTVGDD